MTPEKLAEPEHCIDPPSSRAQRLALARKGTPPETGDGLPSNAPSGRVGIETLVANIAALAQVQHVALSLQDSVQESIQESIQESVQDWNMMFRAVEDRLTTAVGKVLVATPGLAPKTAAVLVQTIVLECVTALGQLHQALALERSQRERLEIPRDGTKGGVKTPLAAVPISGSDARSPHGS